MNHPHHTPEFQTFLKAIAHEWNRLVPKGTVEVINSVSDRSDFIKTIYLSPREHANRPTNFYPHIHIFLERHNYMFTVSCAKDKHFMHEILSLSSFSPTEYCAYFQQLLKTRCASTTTPSSSHVHAAIAFTLIIVIMTMTFGQRQHKHRLLMIILFVFVLMGPILLPH